jgi:hypothetical protein
MNIDKELMNMAKLTQQQKKFVELYMSNGMNVRESAVGAGYSEKSATAIGCMLLKKPHVIEAINSIKQQIAEKIDVDVDWIKDELIKNVELARKANRFTDSNTAIKLIGELIGAFQQEGKEGITINVLELLGKIDKPATIVDITPIMVEGKG